MKKVFIFSMLLLSGLSFAQQGEIIYTDYEPDSVKHFTYNEQLLLDIDKDGINEWHYYAVSGDWGHYLELQLVSNMGWNNPDYQVTSLFGKGDSYPRDGDKNPNFPQFGDTLSSCVWVTFPNPQYEWGYEHHWHGNDHNPTDHYFEPHYMGVRHRVGEGEYCYGWIEASVYIHTWAIGQTDFQSIDLTVYRTAYCTIPNYPFRVGQTDFTWDTEENITSAFAAIRPNPTNSEITITGKDLKSATVYNALGQRVAVAETNGDRLLVDLSSQPTGIYFVNVTDQNGKRCVKKVVKQ